MLKECTVEFTLPQRIKTFTLADTFVETHLRTVNLTILGDFIMKLFKSLRGSVSRSIIVL